jgi:uncharacterized membrane protein
MKIIRISNLAIGLNSKLSSIMRTWKNSIYRSILKMHVWSSDRRTLPESNFLAYTGNDLFVFTFFAYWLVCIHAHSNSIYSLIISRAVGVSVDKSHSDRQSVCRVVATSNYTGIIKPQKGLLPCGLSKFALSL